MQKPRLCTARLVSNQHCRLLQKQTKLQWS